MYSTKLITSCFIVIALLSACGGSDDAAPVADSNSINVTPSLGLVTNATVKFYQSDTTTLPGEGDTGSTGTVIIEYSNGYNGPFLVEVSGGDDAQYYDKAAGVMVDFGAGQLLRAIVPSGTTRAGVIMLTETAYQLSAVNGIGLTDATENQLNERVRQSLAPELMSILTTPTVFDGSMTAGSLGEIEADKYAIRLAALAQLGSGLQAAIGDYCATCMRDIQHPC